MPGRSREPIRSEVAPRGQVLVGAGPRQLVHREAVPARRGDLAARSVRDPEPGAGAPGSLLALSDRPVEVRDAIDQARPFALEALGELLADDVVREAQGVPAITGDGAGHEAFGRVFRALPGLTAVVRRWAADGDVVFIEFTLVGELGGRPISWRAVDRFFVREGL